VAQVAVEHNVTSAIGPSIGMRVSAATVDAVTREPIQSA
jgi:hypothetical protein